MSLRSIPILFAIGAVAFAGDSLVRGSNESVEVQAKVYYGKEAVKGLIGSDLDGFICIVEVKILPLTDKAIAINKDDFSLRSDRDGQKSPPFAPSQIAGQGAMIVKSRPNGYGILGDSNGPTYGGMGGLGRGPGSGGAVGNGTATTTTNEISMDKGDAKKQPLLDLLKERQLPDKETADPVSGLLYFPLEGKHKTKDLELLYKGPGGKVAVHFQ
jgi:hypothetical protein